MKLEWIISLVLLQHWCADYTQVLGDIKFNNCSQEIKTLWPPSTAQAGGSDLLRFRCNVGKNLTSSFNVTWTKNDQALEPSDHIYLKDSGQELIVQPPLISNDTGKYACVVTRLTGYNCMVNGQVYVVPNAGSDAPYVVETSPADGMKTVTLGGSTQISCVISRGTQLPVDLNPTWLRNKTLLPDDSHHTWEYTELDGKIKLKLNITNVTREDLGEYTCLGTNSYGSDNRTITLMEYQPAPPGGNALELWQIIVIAVGGFVVLVISVAMGILIWHRRQEQLQWPEVDPEKFDVPGYALEYDVFISYSSDDEEWVQEELFAKLQNLGYTVNIDFKDFVPGMAIAENIMDSIYKSRKTIVLMSKNFLKSMWGQFELQQAHNKAIAQRKDVLILIKFDKCKVPSKLMGKTFLDWSDENIQPHFWQRLQDALGEPVDYAELKKRHDEANGDHVPDDPDERNALNKEYSDEDILNEVNTENDRNEIYVEDVTMRPKLKNSKDNCDVGLDEEEREGIRISQEERMQLIA